MKHSNQINSEFQKHAAVDGTLFPGQPGWEDQHSDLLSNQLESEKFATGPNGASDDRTFRFEITVEGTSMEPPFFPFHQCGQDCPYLEYQGNPQGEYKGTPWCNLFRKDLSYNRTQGTSHPNRSPECVSAVEGLM